MIHRRLPIAWLGLILLIGRPAAAQSYEPAWESLDARPIPAWFNEAKFGIFIHWGVYSVPAYRPLSDRRYASYAEWYYASVIHDRENGGQAFHVADYGEDFEYRDFAPLFPGRTLRSRSLGGPVPALRGEIRRPHQQAS